MVALSDGKQNFKCRDCVRQFVMTPRHQPISEATKELIDRLLLEKMSLAGIVRATGVSSRWLQYYVNKKLGAVKREVEVKSKKKGKLTIQCDEMWSFVGNKDNKQWIWLELMHQPKKLSSDILAKDIKLALKDYGILCHQFQSQCAVSYTDFWSA